MPKLLNTELGTLFRAKRKELKQSQMEVAKRARMSHVTVSKIERGLVASDETLTKLAKALDLDVDFVLDKAHRPVEDRNDLSERRLDTVAHYHGHKYSRVGNRVDHQQKHVQLIVELPTHEDGFAIEPYLSFKLENGQSVSLRLHSDDFHESLWVGHGTDPRIEQRGFVSSYTPRVKQAYFGQVGPLYLHLTVAEMNALCEVVDRLCSLMEQHYHELEERFGCRHFTYSPTTGGWRILKIPLDWWRYLLDMAPLPLIDGCKVEMTEMRAIVSKGSERGVFSIESCYTDPWDPRVWVAFQSDGPVTMRVDQAKSWFSDVLLTYLVRRMKESQEVKTSWGRVVFFTGAKDVALIIDENTRVPYVPDDLVGLPKMTEHIHQFFIAAKAHHFEFTLKQAQDLDGAVQRLEAYADTTLPNLKSTRPIDAFRMAHIRNRSGDFTVPKGHLDLWFRCLVHRLPELHDQLSDDDHQAIESAVEPFWAYVRKQDLWKRYRRQFVGPTAGGE